MNALQAIREQGAVEAAPARFYFQLMPADAQRSAIRRLALSGMSEEAIAEQLGWPAQSVREVIAVDRHLLHTALTHQGVFGPAQGGGTPRRL